MIMEIEDTTEIEITFVRIEHGDHYLDEHKEAVVLEVSGKTVKIVIGDTETVEVDCYHTIEGEQMERT